MDVSSDAPVSSPAALPNRPFRGIEPFRYADAPILFGRDRDVQRLLRAVTIHRFVPLFGDSGAGKSSLVNAGLLPAAIAEGYRPERVRVQPVPGAELVVERIRSGETASDGHLPSGLLRDEAESEERVVLAAADLRARLAAVADDRVPLLVFDQLEELVTLFERGEDARAAQRAVIDALSDLILDPDLSVKLLLVFREDYLAKLGKLLARCPNLQDHGVRVTAPPAEELGELLRGPFERFPGEYTRELSPALADQLAAALRARSDSDGLNLSEIQIACLRLWQADDPQRLFEEKGLEGLLEDYLLDAVATLDPSERDPAVGLLTRMVTSSGTRNVISRDDLLGRVEQEDGIDPALLERTLAALEGPARLVRSEPRHDVYVYEIVSEFLVPSIRRRGAERAEAAKRRKLAAELAREQKTARRLRVLTALALLLAILAVGTAAWGWIEKRNADRATAAAERTAAKLQRGLIREEVQASLLAVNPIARIKLGLDAVNDMQKPGAGVGPGLREQVGGAVRQAILASRLLYGVGGATGARILRDARRRDAALTHDAPAAGTVWAPGHQVGVEIAPGRGRVMLLRQGLPPRVLRRFVGRITAVAFSPDGRLIATGNDGGTPRVWDARTGELIAQLLGHVGPIVHVAFSPDSHWLVSVGNDGTARVWQEGTGRLQAVLGPVRGMRFAAFQTSGGLVITGPRVVRGHEIVRVWDLGFALGGVGLPSTGCGGGPIGVPVGRPRNIALPRAPKGAIPSTTSVVGETPTSAKPGAARPPLLAGLSFVRGTADLIAICGDGSINQIDGGGTGSGTAYVGLGAPVAHAVVDPTGRIVAAIGMDGTVRARDLASGQGWTFGSRSGPKAIAVDVAAGGRLVLTVAANGRVSAYQLPDGRRLGRSSIPAGVVSAAFGPSGRYVVAVSGHRATVYRRRTGAVVAKVKGRADSVVASPSGGTFIRIDGDLADVVSLTTGKVLRPLGNGASVHVSTIRGVALSEDGRWAVSGALGGGIGIWNVGSGSRIASLTSDVGVAQVAFSATGVMAAAADDRGRLRFYSCAVCVPFKQLVSVARARLRVISGRDLAKGSAPPGIIG